MRNMDAQDEIIIVGAGPGGLASSLLLAQAGLKVKVFEKEDRAGGRTKIIEKDGFKFDLGPTFFHYTEVIEKIFEAIGRDAHADLNLHRLEMNYRLVFGQGGSLDCTSDVEQMYQRIAELSGGKDADAFITYMKQNKRKLDNSRQCLEEPWFGPSDMISKRAMRAATVIHPTRSVAKDLAKLFDDERLHLAMSFQTKYLGMSPFNCPSLFTILAYLEYEYGIYHPLGGLGSVTQKMYEIAEGMGVEFHFSEPVEKIIVEDNKAKGIVTKNGEFRADRVVLNADFAKAMVDLVDDSHLKKWTSKKLEKKKYSCSTFMLYLGIDKVYEDLPHHQIYASSDYKNSLAMIENNELTTNDPSVYAQNACITDKSLAPDGQSTVYVLVPVSHTTDNIDWSEVKDEYRELVLDQLENKLGFENLREHIVTEMVITPDDWGDICYRGAVFNLAHGLDQMLWRRPKNRFGDIKNMYLVGGGTHPGSGLPVIFESARISTKLLLDDLGIEPDWNGVDTWFESRKPNPMKAGVTHA